MRSATRVATLVAALAAAVTPSACGSGAGARLEATLDTLTLYGPIPAAPPLRLVHAGGETTQVRDPRLTVSADSAVRAQDGLLLCHGAGDAVVTAKERRRSTTFVARCRPLARVEGAGIHVLEVGGAPGVLRLDAVFRDGTREPLRHFQVVSDDTTVVRVRGDTVRAVAVGRARLTLHAGGVVLPGGPVSVRETLVSDSLGLAPGEFRSWRLAKGRFEITVAPVTTRAAYRSIEMTTEGARCQRDGRSEETIHCVVHDSGAVAVRNVAAAGGRVQQARVWIVKAP